MGWGEGGTQQKWSVIISRMHDPSSGSEEQIWSAFKEKNIKKTANFSVEDQRVIENTLRKREREIGGDKREQSLHV